MACAKDFSPNRRSSNHGFTLIEVVVSLTLMAVIGAVVLSGLRTGMGATEKGQQELVKVRSRLSTVQILRNQIRGAVPLLYWIPEGASRSTHIAFAGERNSLRFISRDSLFDGPNGLPRWVELSWRDAGAENAAVNVKEFRIIPPDNAAAGNPIGEVTLLPGSEVWFEYLRRARGTEPLRWLKEWKMDEQREFPAAVRFTVRSGKHVNTMLIPLEFAASNWRGLGYQ